MVPEDLISLFFLTCLRLFLVIQRLCAVVSMANVEREKKTFKVAVLNNYNMATFDICCVSVFEQVVVFIYWCAWRW